MSRIVIGLGTGRCGTKSLAFLLNQQSGVRISHERWPPLPWRVSERDLRHKLCDLASSMAIAGDIGFYYLPYVERLLQIVPDIRFVCLRRDRNETVRSYLRKTIGRHHWTVHGGERWRVDPVWDPCFPKFDVSSKKDAIQCYWDLYNDMTERFAARYESFRVFGTNALNTSAGVHSICSFIGVSGLIQNERVRLNVSKEKAGVRKLGLHRHPD